MKRTLLLILAMPVLLNCQVPVQEDPHEDYPHTILVVSAHPDDESIFGGGLLPYYSQVRGYRVVLLNMVSRNPDGSYPLTGKGEFGRKALKLGFDRVAGRTGCADESPVRRIVAAVDVIRHRKMDRFSRLQTLRDAVDVFAGRPRCSGQLNQHGHYVSGAIILVEGGFTGTGFNTPDPVDTWFDTETGYGWGKAAGVTSLTPGLGNMLQMKDGRAAVALVIAGEMRRYQPCVVTSLHDLQGDYGHSNHTAVSIGVIDAFNLAADPDVAIADLPPWDSQKLYIRGGPMDNPQGIEWEGFLGDGGINPLFHCHWEEESISDRSPRQVADEGLTMHVTEGPYQIATVYVAARRYRAKYSEWWTLYRSRVGPDTRTDFDIPGDMSLSRYHGWARGDFFENIEPARPTQEAD